jgi:murein DD-endopeptidase MepM/ murein hydrolase activator NlpD
VGLGVFLVLGLFLFGLAPIYQDYQGKSGVWGGPAEALTTYSAPKEQGLEAALLMAQSPISPGSEPFVSGEAVLAQGALQDSGRVFASAAGTSLLIYKVQKGDTISTIAQEFGTSAQAIMSANPEVKTRALRVGQELSLQPVSGILYQIRPEESLELVALKHGLTVDQLKDFNKSISLTGSTQGTTIVIPTSPPPASVKEPAGMPSIRGYFVMPTTGFNWGKLHNRNGVDIANACGTTVFAAQEGMVTVAEEDGWNGGYGGNVIIEHPNGTKTRYAHLENVLVSLGDYVSQKEKIGLMGNTGESTGCHLHFEVEGAKNPFVK